MEELSYEEWDEMSEEDKALDYLASILVGIYIEKQQEKTRLKKQAPNTDL